MYAGGSTLNPGIYTPLDGRTSKFNSASWGPVYGDPTLPPGTRYYDNPNEFFTLGFQRNNYIIISGGTEKVTNFLSVGNFRQTGVVPIQDFERTSVKFNNSTQAFKWLKLSGNMTYNYSTATRLREGGNWSAPMIALYRGPSDYDYTNGYSDPLNTPDAYLSPDRSKQKTGSIYDNPYFSVNHNQSTEKIHRVLGFV